MHAKSVLIGLLGITALTEATAISRPYDQIMNRRAARSLNARQNGQGQGGNRFGQGQGQGQGQNGQNGQNGQAGNNGQQGQAGQNGQQGGNNNNQNNGGNAGNAAGGNQAALTLNADAVQTGSASDGDPNAAEGEAASKT